jgi:hypothetical protein
MASSQDKGLPVTSDLKAAADMEHVEIRKQDMVLCLDINRAFKALSSLGFSDSQIRRDMQHACIIF